MPKKIYILATIYIVVAVFIFAGLTQGAKAATPSAPRNLNVTSTSTSSISLSWAAPSSDGGSPITQYNIWFDTASQPAGQEIYDETPGTVNGSTLSYTKSGLNPNSIYYFKVTADNQAGQSSYSNEVSGNTSSSPQAINGQCAPSHYRCNVGATTNNVDGSSSYTWACNGSNGGSDASCSEQKAAGSSSQPSPPAPSGLVQCGGIDPSTGNAQPACDKIEFYKLLSRLFKYLIFISGIAVVLSITAGGFFMIISAGSEEKLSYAKKTITAAVVGLIVVLVGWMAVNTVITTFTNCSGKWYVFEEFNCSSE